MGKEHIIKWVIAITSFCAGAAIGFWAEVLKISISYSLAILFSVFTVFGFIIFIFLSISKKMWPNRDNWKAEFKHNSIKISIPELQNTLSIDKRLSWISPEPQSEGDSYNIDLGKDKGRVICGIEFYEFKPSNEVPRAWRLLLKNKYGALVDRPIEGEEKSIVLGFKPTKISAIEVVIKDPMLKSDGTPYHWRIENIYLLEAKVFGKYLKRII